MRPYITTILLLIGQCLFAQLKPDTTISKRALDSLQHELAGYKDAVRKNYLMHVVEENTVATDSIYSIKKDSLFVINHSSKGNILRRQIFGLNSFGCKTSLNAAYYDTTGRLLYEEQWKLDCMEEKGGLNGFMNSRRRYQYDSTGKENGMIAEFWDGGGHRVRRFDYSINALGNKVWGKTYKLSPYAFWD